MTKPIRSQRPSACSVQPSLQPGSFLATAATLSLLLTAVFAGQLQAASLLDPYASANRNPFVEIYGLPAARSAQQLQQGELTTALQLEAANSFTRNSKGGESIVIDGESIRSNFQLRLGLSERWQLGLDIPYLSHDGGNLDSFIDEWHDFFGLPDGDRPAYPRDQLSFSYQRGGQSLVDIQRSSDGLGDVSVSAAYQLSNTVDRQWSLQGQLKLPTGDAAQLLGSESTDLALALHVTEQGWLAVNGVVLHGSLGVLWMDGGEVMDELREDWVVYGSSTLAWQFTDNTSLKIQLDGHSAFYDSELKELGSPSAQLILGGAVRLSEHWLLDLAVSEDIAVDTAPDVVFMIGIKGGAF